jgi:hypothetical protein
METSASIPTPTLTDSQLLQLMNEHRPRPVPATKYERWKGAACLFFLFLFLAMTSRVSVHFRAMFEEMELGTLPGLTNLVLAWSTLQLKQPWVFTSGMFVASWVYFSWVCKDRRRLVWFHSIVMGAVLALALLVAVGLFSPLMGLMEKIG